MRRRPVSAALRWLLRGACAAVAWAAWSLGIRRAVVLENLRLAFPEKSARERRAIARATYRNLGRMAADFFLVPRLTAEELEGAFEYEGWDRYQAALALGTGVVACTAHFGNFELLAAVHNLKGIPITMVSRAMGRSIVNDLWRRIRARAGIEDLIVRRGETLAAVRRSLAAGRVIGYVIDQNQPRRSAVFPTFFGVAAATSATPAVLAMRTGAAVLFTVAVPLGGGRHRVVIEGPLPVPRTGDRDRDILAFMQDLNDRLERQVRLHPDQWYWLHRRWKTRPPPAEAGRRVDPPLAAR